MGRIARRQGEGRNGRWSDHAPVLRARDPWVAVGLEWADDLVRVRPERRDQLNGIAPRQLLEMPERFAESGPVTCDRDVSARGPRKRGSGIVSGARAQRVPADPFDDDDVDVKPRDDEPRQRRALDGVKEELL